MPDQDEPLLLDFQDLPLEYAQQIFPPLWVVYMRPDDYPDGYVVRVHWGMTPEPTAFKCATLAEARAHIQDAGGCFRMDPQQGDVACILETWL